MTLYRAYIKLVDSWILLHEMKTISLEDYLRIAIKFIFYTQNYVQKKNEIKHY